MTLSLQRNLFVESGILGQLGAYATLEHAYLQDDGTYKPKIAAGISVWKRYLSPKHGYEVFRCESIDGANVEAHEYEIHIGNYNKDSDGCILIGLSLGNMLNGGKMVCRSDDAFKAFMAANSSDTITIEITD